MSSLAWFRGASRLLSVSAHTNRHEYLSRAVLHSGPASPGPCEKVPPNTTSPSPVLSAQISPRATVWTAAGVQGSALAALIINREDVDTETLREKWRKSGGGVGGGGGVAVILRAQSEPK